MYIVILTTFPAFGRKPEFPEKVHDFRESAFVHFFLMILRPIRNENLRVKGSDGNRSLASC